MSEVAARSNNTQPTLTLWRQDGLVLLDIEPGVSLKELLTYECPYILQTEENRHYVRQGLKLTVGLYWPEDHIVSLDHDKTTLGFTPDQLANIKEEPRVIAERLNDLLSARLIGVDTAIPEAS